MAKNQRLYSPATGCTYIPNISTDIPADAVPISEERFLEVLAVTVAGKVLGHDAEGLPVLIDAQAPATDLAMEERQWRDGRLAEMIWLRDRHRDQLEIGVQTNLSAEQFRGLLTYLQALRDWPQSSDFPDINFRPVAPAFLEQQGRPA
ncbi:phage tail assembly chaperone [Pseudomonas entomophila]|uniref:phage tail assembly chaperone n=1 Tax=Pseudomonas entomophila TaxID=312306 RepID=UPI00200F481D|nr:phage tail assembly chaperone [Pseudomonas entomophila]